MAMKQRIWEKKLIFVNFLKSLSSESLAKQIFDEQVKRGWPGLCREAQKICEELGLPNILKESINKNKWDSMVKKATRNNHEEELKAEVESKKKLEAIKEENMRRKEYFETKSLENTRLMFRIRTRMIDLKANFKNKPTNKKDGWKCEGCGTEIETNCHVLVCKAYEQVRAGKDLKCDEDLVQFFKQVMKIRMKKKE